MITTIASLLLCSTVAARQAPDIPRDLGVCVDIATAAHDHGLSPRLAVAVGYRESRWRHGLVSSVGAVGPMQIRPEYHCDGGTADGCDLVATGVQVLRRYLDEEGAAMPALCRYATGTGHSRCAYALRVLDVAGGGA